MRILGIDPGSKATGFGVIEQAAGRLSHVVHGTLRPPRTATQPERLSFLYDAIREVAEQNAPDLAVVEQVFVAPNARSALVLGEARGVALAALACAGLTVHERAAREVKKAVVGTGAASKVQVQAMVVHLLGLERPPASDAADALAAAICEAHARRLSEAGARSRRPSRGAHRRAFSRRILQ